MRAPAYELGRVTADLVVLTVLPEEYGAVLACLREPGSVRGSTAMPNTCAWRLGMIDASHYDAPFKVVVGMGTPTTTFGALAAIHAIGLFDPRYVAFVGVAGGFERDGQRHGDVAVSSFVTAYEYGKVDTGGFAPRGNFTYRCNEALVHATDAARATGAPWWRDDENPAGPPSVRTGMIASGDKVIDDPDETFFAAVRAAWPKLLAVEMEGAGVAAAVHEVQGHRAVGFILVRGISDMPHRKAPGASASTEERDRWKVTASRNAARFLAHLVATAWPVPPRDDGDAASEPTTARAEPATSVVSGSRAVAGQVLTPTPSYLNAEVQALSEWLRDAQARKQTLRDAGLATHDVDREILQLRRQLREGGQLRAGDTLGDGRYLLIKPVGRGGFAVVWEAHDTVAKRSVAVKVLHQHIAGEWQRRERFFRGARVMMDLQHAAVVRVYEPRGEDDAFCYFVMELMCGGNLRDAVLGQRVEVGRRLALILQVAEALAEAHGKQLVHRDVKPANILLDGQGNAKLTDFDLVGAHDTTGGTHTGALGTFIYAAPECLDRPQEATARVDVFSLGMTAIFCLSGQDLSMATFRNPAATVARLACSAAVRGVLERAVAWEPEMRFADAAALIAAMRGALAESPHSATPRDERTAQDPSSVATAQPSEPSGPAGSRRGDGVESTFGIPRRPRWAIASSEDRYGLWAAFEINGVQQRMRWIPPGTFRMGSPETERGRYDDEGPQHDVTLSRGYWLGETPVTQALWVAVMGANPSRFCGNEAEDLQRPVEQVSWDDCQAFLDRLNPLVSGLAARLPTEAEWERACRGGTTSATWAGDLSGDDVAPELEAIAWYGGNGGAKTHPVGLKAPNPYGLYDMLGNVWEWCADEQREYEAKPVTDPALTRRGPFRVYRGGSWDVVAGFVRAAYRDAYNHGGRLDLGFRLAGDQESVLR